MGKLFIGVLIGLLLGGALTFYFFVGVPRAAQAPGIPIAPPDAIGIPPGTAQIVLRQDFFNNVLQTIFRDMNAPAFPLNLTGENRNVNSGSQSYALLQNSNQCDGKITLLPEGSGVQSSVRFDNNKIAAPLAFSGSTSILGNCVQFNGWAQANLELRFDPNEQNVIGQVNIETVNLDGISPLVSGFVTPLVQSTLNSRVNPIQMLQGKQIALNVPIAATNGNLTAKVKDVRAEVKDNALNLYVIYDFAGKAAQ